MCAELKDNSRLNQLVHDSCMSVMDYDDDDSQKSGSICLPQQPPMKASKSDVSPSLRQVIFKRFLTEIFVFCAQHSYRSRQN